jgi:U32 family peptidase
MQTELLLPVGNMTMALAAIHNGANAIYVGFPGFNARGRSHDHELAELKEIIDTCHLYNVHVHLALNILIFENELDKLQEMLKQVLPLGADAFIVQDLGVIQLINKLAPNQVVHGSTQMTVTNFEAMELLADLKIERFVLGRENSLPEIAAIKDKTKKELEVFVHGALCVAYSGQCFTSEAIGGRSANRGQCAQSCRQEYELLVDGVVKPMGDLKYLVSPRDLCGLEDVPKLVELGIESFKIEGRLKSPEYVAQAARSYREAIDNYSQVSTKENIKKMAITYSRGFYNGWMNGVAHQKLVDGTFGSNRGLVIGKVLMIKNQQILIQTQEELFPGDGLLFAEGKLEVGGPIYQIKQDKSGLWLGMSRDFSFDKIKVGQAVYLNSRDKFFKELKQSYTDKQKMKRLAISMQFRGEEGGPLHVLVKEGDYQVELESSSLLEKATTQALNEETLFENFKGLSHTAYFLQSIKVEVSNNLFIHQRELKALKQKLVEELNHLRLKREITVTDFDYRPTKRVHKKAENKLTVLVRSFNQLEGLVAFIVQWPHYKNYLKQVVLDYEFGKDFVPSVKLLKEHGIASVIATTRVLKPNEYHNFRLIERANPDGILIRNLGALFYFQNSPYKLYGDFSLNVTNSLSFNYLLSKKLETLCVSYDMNTQQLNALLEHVDTTCVEITAHQYMPEFHMEHCVFAAFLSKGNSFRDCGKPCEKHRVQLKDMYGNMHELKADQECRNTMFNAKSLSAASLIPAWQDRGVSNFRFEALHETGEELSNKLINYFKLMSGEIAPHDVTTQLGALESYGVTTGQLLNTKVYKDRKKHV